MKTFKLRAANTFIALILTSSLAALAEPVKLDSYDVFNSCRIVQDTNFFYGRTAYEIVSKQVIKLQGTNSFGTLVIDQAEDNYAGLKRLTLQLQNLQSEGKCL